MRGFFPFVSLRVRMTLSTGVPEAGTLCWMKCCRAGPTPKYAGTSWRDCIQPKTQGMARRSSMLRWRAELAAPRWAGGGPMPARSTFGAAGGADARVLQFGDRRGLLEVGEGLGVVDDVLAVEGVGGRGDLIESGFPLGKDFAGQMRGINRGDGNRIGW